MVQSKLYFIIRRNQANLSEANFATVVNLVKDIVGINGQPANHNHWRGNLDTYVNIDDGLTYSNEYIFEAQFAQDAVSFDSFKTKLVNTFGVNPEDVTYTTGTQTVKDRPSVFATYKYNSINRLIVGLFGWADENTPCTWEQSREEAKQYIINNIASWE